MKIDNLINKTPWDSKVFALNTFEIIINSETMIAPAIQELVRQNIRGHYTIKVDPLWNSKILNDWGFYYCDTLIKPYCSLEKLIIYDHQKVTVDKENCLEELLDICHGAFLHGRFHRDFNLDKKQADRRYNSWLSQLFAEKKVWGLMYENELAGFWGFSDKKILLHALKHSYRGKGMAKYFWSAACQEMFKLGYKEIVSSISSSNMAVLNLYKTLGFKFKNPQDVYHLLIN